MNSCTPRRIGIATTFALSLVLAGASSLAAAPSSLSTSDLFKAGQIGYARGNCVTASRFWFAYLLREPSDLTATRRAKLESVISECERFPTRFSFTNASFHISNPSEMRCDAYAETAVAQFEASRLVGCNLSDNRWNANKRFHKNWCLHAPESEANSERLKRNEILTTCMANKP